MPVASPKDKTIKKIQPPYNLVLLDDDDHSDKYVIQMCQTIFGYPPEKGMQIAKEVNSQKRVIIYSGSLEVVEFKQEQVHAFGPDPLIQRCQGSMTAVIEKAV